MLWNNESLIWHQGGEKHQPRWYRICLKIKFPCGPTVGTKTSFHSDSKCFLSSPSSVAALFILFFTDKRAFILCLCRVIKWLSQLKASQVSLCGKASVTLNYQALVFSLLSHKRTLCSFRCIHLSKHKRTPCLTFTREAIHEKREGSLWPLICPVKEKREILNIAPQSRDLVFKPRLILSAIAGKTQQLLQEATHGKQIGTFQKRTCHFCKGHHQPTTMQRSAILLVCACLLWFNDRDEAGSHHSRWQQKPSVLLLIINPAGSVPAAVLTQLEERYGWGFPLKELTYPSADGQFHHCSAHFCQKLQQNDFWLLVFP